MSKSRAADVFVVWALSIILAAVFLLAGIPKLVGGGTTLGLQAAAMRNFPAPLRVIVGLVEVLGGIALLIPSVATFAAVLLAFVMIPATFTQYASGEGSVFIPPLLCVALLFLAWRRNVVAVSKSYHQFADAPHPLLHEGVIAGLIGAVSIAAWFFIIDLISGRPFFTPATLGRGLVAVLGAVPDGERVPHILAYTVFHFAAFMIVGLFAAFVIYLAKSVPSVLLGFVVLFVAFEVGFYAIVGLLAQATPLGSFAWYQVLIGNLIAASAMGFYFWRQHKELAEEFRHSLDWEISVVAPEFHNKGPVSAPSANSIANANASETKTGA
jgi:uncharacterized membrane protein YphA (DoxX/SURF4 family)